MDEFAQPTSIDWSGEVGIVQYGKDNNVVMFYNKSVLNPAKSKEVGLPQHEDKIFVRIHPPGERLSIIDRPATGQDSRRYPVQWGQFQQQKEQTADGCPIELLYPERPAIAANLRASGIQTIEQCANVSGTVIDSIMGGQQYANDAKKYLDIANKGMAASQVRHELEQRDSQIRTLNQTVEMLKGQLAQMQANSQNQPSISDLHQLLAGLQRGGTPQFPPAGVAPTQVFDAQTAQINALSAQTELANTTRKRGRPRKA